MTDTALSATQTELFRGKVILAEHRDAMVDRMEQFPSVKDRREAELAIDQLWDRWAYRMMDEKGYPHEQAEIALDAGIQFVARASNGCFGVPTKTEDDGWHVMLPYTVEYRVFCDVVVGRFVHHRPNDIIGALYQCDCPEGHDDVTARNPCGHPPCGKCSNGAAARIGVCDNGNPPPED